jgi:hypothetical protein
MKMAARLRHNKQPGALKHGGYSALGLLPGESPAEFEQLHKALAEEFAPRGPLEEDIISSLARLLWRKQNRSTFRTAALAIRRYNEITNEEIAARNIPSSYTPLDFPRNEEAQAAREEAKRVKPLSINGSAASDIP